MLIVDARRDASAAAWVTPAFSPVQVWNALRNIQSQNKTEAALYSRPPRPPHLRYQLTDSNRDKETLDKDDNNNNEEIKPKLTGTDLDFISKLMSRLS